MGKTEKEKLQAVLDNLKEAAQKFRTLDQEVHVAGDKKDFELYRQKNKEKAQLLIDLPSQLEGCLNSLDSLLRITIKYVLQCFANEAEKLLQSDNQFGLAVLLMYKGSSVNDKNELEKLIDRLEEGAF